MLPPHFFTSVIIVLSPPCVLVEFVLPLVHSASLPVTLFLRGTSILPVIIIILHF